MIYLGACGTESNIEERNSCDMRIDKFLTGAGVASRSESAKAAKRGDVAVNGQIVRRADIHIDPERDTVLFCGEEIKYKK